MAQLNLTEADAILKEFYIGPVREQLNLGTPLLAELGKTEKGVVGKRVYVPTHLSRSEAVGARSETGNLPTAQSQGYQESTFNVKYLYARIAVTLPTIEAMKSDQGAFLRAVDSETRGALSELKEDVDRQIAANTAAARGRLFHVADAEASGQSVLSQETGASASEFRRVRVGQTVDIYKDVTGTPTKIADSVTVDAVDASAGTITISGTLSADADDETFVYREDSFDNELVGLPGIVAATGELQGIDPADSGSEPWAATVNDNSGTARALSEDLMQQVVDSVAIASGMEPTRIVGEHTQRRKFYALLTSLKRAVNTLELKGGYKALSFNDDIPIIVDRFVDDDKLFFINPSHIQFYQMSDWKWADHDGSVLSRVSNKAEFEAFLYKYCELGTDRRNAHGQLADLST